MTETTDLYASVYGVIFNVEVVDENRFNISIAMQRGDERDFGGALPVIWQGEASHGENVLRADGSDIDASLCPVVLSIQYRHLTDEPDKHRPRWLFKIEGGLGYVVTFCLYLDEPPILVGTDERLV